MDRDKHRLEPKRITIPRSSAFIRGSSLRQWLLLGVALAFIAGCVGEPREAVRKTPAFPHKRHVKDEEMACTACHKLDANTGKYSLPANLKSCMQCHEAIDEKKPAEKRIGVFMKGDKPLWTNVTQLPAEVKFSHKPHNDAKLQCGTCHKGIETSTVITSRVRQDMRACIDCHAKQHVGEATDNCAYCHTAIGKKWRPINHSRDWTELHGRVAANVSKGSSADCLLCHNQSSCTNCHRVEAPRSHTNHWRQRGHGITASLDRSSCKTCHTPDSCVRCHKTIAPQSHKANWADRHCLNCHVPLKDERCFACHKTTPSHTALAPRVPNNAVHQRATADDCRDCHLPGRLLPHPDNGQSCLDCHQR